MQKMYYKKNFIINKIMGNNSKYIAANSNSKSTTGNNSVYSKNNSNSQSVKPVNKGNFIHDIGRAYHFTKDIISLPFMIYFMLSTLVKLFIITLFCFGIYEIINLGKFIYNNFKNIESLIKKYISDIINDIKNLIQKIKSLF